MYNCSVTEECAGKTEENADSRKQKIGMGGRVRKGSGWPAQFVVGEWNGWMIADLYRETIRGCEKT